MTRQLISWLLGVLLAMAFAAGSLAEQWSIEIESGATSFEAEFVRMDGEEAVLKRPDGRAFRVPLDRLSAKDRDRITALLHSDEAPQAIKAGPAPFRRWTGAELEGAFVEQTKSGDVVLRSVEGWCYTVPPVALSIADKQHIQEQLAQEAEDDPAPLSDNGVESVLLPARQVKSEQSSPPAGGETQTPPKTVDADKLSKDELQDAVDADVRAYEESYLAMGEAGPYLKENVPARLSVWQKASEMKMPQGQFLLAQCLQAGIGVPEDQKAAFQLCRRAAEQGHPSAQHALGVVYFAGHGIDQDPESARNWFVKAAEQGHTKAQYNLGVMFRDGIGGTQDASKAIDWFRKAAEGEKGYFAAQFNLGAMYYDGQGVETDEEEALRWFVKGAEQGDDRAAYNIGIIHLNNPTEENLKIAFNCFRAAAERGYADAQFQLGKMYDSGTAVPKDRNEAVKWFLEAAEQGQAYAQCCLCLFYDALPDGENKTKRFQWLHESAENNCAIAQLFLGAFYEEGTIVPKDHTKALQWFRKAASQGTEVLESELDAIAHMRKSSGFSRDVWQTQCRSLYILGTAYHEGRGVEKDDTEALKWFTMAIDSGTKKTPTPEQLESLIECVRNEADRNVANAQYYLGELYQRGYVPEDEKEVVKWFSKAAEQGHAKAQSELGLLYAAGEGVTQDDSVAVEWYRKAVDQGDVNAMCNLGYMYQHGRGLPEAPNKLLYPSVAISYYRKAAELGCAPAQFNLGVAYERGRGVAQDFEQAFEWYRKAAAQGNDSARNALRNIEKNGFWKEDVPRRGLGGGWGGYGGAFSYGESDEDRRIRHLRQEYIRKASRYGIGY